jgi:DNA replication protein DnaC
VPCGSGVGALTRPSELIVDELGSLPLEKETANLFFQLVSRRYERGSLLLTTNQTITQWGKCLRRPGSSPRPCSTACSTTATSWSSMGDSFRLRQKKRAGLLGSNRPVTNVWDGGPFYWRFGVRS